MLIALDAKKNSIHAKMAKKDRHYFCPACLQMVILKRGQHKIAHFAHAHNQACDSFSEGETAEHLQAKMVLYSWLKRQDCPVQLEAYLAQLKQRPDLLVANLAIEVQCSPLKINRFLERNQGYLAHQYDPWWLIGYKLQPKKHQFRPLVKSMFRSNYHHDFYFYGFDQKNERIIYYGNILWHYRKGYLYQRTFFSLKTTRLMQVLLFQAPKTTPIFWLAKEYRFFIQNQLFRQQRHFLELQEFCYLHQENLLDLPDWCYYPSKYQVLFTHDLLILRLLYLKSSDLKSWLRNLKSFHFSWEYIFLSQADCLMEIYLECKKLSQSSLDNVKHNSSI